MNRKFLKLIKQVKYFIAIEKRKNGKCANNSTFSLLNEDIRVAGVVPVITLTDCVSPLMSRVSDTVAQPASYLLLLTLTPVTHTDQRLTLFVPHKKGCRSSS